ncbi:hypothetical protein ACMAZE_00780 [Pseudopelagicola sp. nBUS_20]|uniref:hypothetical protein n=1 Tax=Pseudopelagicola sp. nBUS_20 TaxID=3395317 RepID=UPI003EB801AB
MGQHLQVFRCHLCPSGKKLENGSGTAVNTINQLSVKRMLPVMPQLKVANTSFLRFNITEIFFLIRELSRIQKMARSM